MSDNSYYELHCTTNFSFLRGASYPEELIGRAAELGYGGLAITDECSLAGVVRAHGKARELGLPLIVGTAIGLHDGPRLVILATDREAYGDLSQLITRGRRAAGKGEYRLGRADFLELPLKGCLVLWLPGDDPDEEQGEWLAARFPGRSWLAVELFGGQGDRRRLRQLRRLGGRTGLPLVAAGDVHMHRRGRRALQDVLTAIHGGRSLDTLGKELFPNGERHLRPLDVVRRIYPEDLVAETGVIARRCRFSLDELRYEYPGELVPEGLTPAQHLRALTEQGMAVRFPHGVPQRVRDQVEHELKLVAELNYEAYFLTVHDIVRFARSRGILCQGRG
ncbi:MAG: PHP domain-containing protein, partial [Gammaproteobacteria bacterium]